MNRTQKDIAEIISQKELFAPLSGSSVLITGATGLIGSMLMRVLHTADLEYGLNLRLTGQIRNEEKAAAVFGDLRNELKLVKVPEEAFDYVVHTVSPTTSRYFIEHPVETIKASVHSTMQILEIARKHGSRVVYLSSMEQYGVPYTPGERMTEDKVGVIDHLNIRSSYSESKRLCECLCASFASEYGVKVSIARLAQTFGAGAPLSDNRMPMQFARSSSKGEDIVLHTAGRSISNVVYLADAMTGILTILLHGAPGEAYNVCNDSETRSVREIAELAASISPAGTSSVRVEIPKENPGYAPDVNMYLNSDKLRALGWIPSVDMKEAYRRLVEYITENG